MKDSYDFGLVMNGVVLFTGNSAVKFMGIIQIGSKYWVTCPKLMSLAMGPLQSCRTYVPSDRETEDKKKHLGKK